MKRNVYPKRTVGNKQIKKNLINKLSLHSNRITEHTTATFPSFSKSHYKIKPYSQYLQHEHSLQVGLCLFIPGRHPWQLSVSPGCLHKAASLQVMADPLTVVVIRFGKARFTHSLGLRRQPVCSLVP